MAFIPAFGIFVGIGLFVFGGIALGVGLIIFGLVKRKRASEEGKKYPYVCMVLGTIILIIPLLLLSGLIVARFG